MLGCKILLKTAREVTGNFEVVGPATIKRNMSYVQKTTLMMPNDHYLTFHIIQILQDFIRLHRPRDTFENLEGTMTTRNPKSFFLKALGHVCKTTRRTANDHNHTLHMQGSVRPHDTFGNLEGMISNGGIHWGGTPSLLA